jgi:hypothetical protein
MQINPFLDSVILGSMYYKFKHHMADWWTWAESKEHSRLWNLFQPSERDPWLNASVILYLYANFYILLKLENDLGEVETSFVFIADFYYQISHFASFITRKFPSWKYNKKIVATWGFSLNQK